MKNKITYFLGFIAISVLITSCGPEKDGFVARIYHNTTSHFNYYYNANVKYKEGVEAVDETFKVPIEGYIPILYYGEPNKSKGGNFDVVIEKCDVALAKHPKSGWVDNLRLLVGKSRFYKGEYVLARHNFQYILKEYPDTKMTPEVYTWLVATYYMSGMESTAEKVLNEKVSDLKLKKKHKGQLAMLKTSIQVEQEEYGLAIKTLEKDIKNIKGTHNKARASYLLGQLYASQDKFSKSYEYFHKVSKMNADYELIFNSKMQIAKLYIEKEDGNVDNSKVMKLLKKMLRDEKNFDYADQIYYQMALLELKNEKEDKALELLKESVSQEEGSNRQKSLSFYKIGQIYFYNQENYDMAEVYFDSASSFITKQDPEYDEITSINKTLKEYVGHVRTIHYQDSMVKLYEMDSVSLARYIDELISEERRKKAEEEAKRREDEESEAMNDPRFSTFNNGGLGQGGNGGSGFYFDSPEGISTGRTDFQRIWGRRKNEDNWRRKNKAIELANNTEGEDSTGDGYDDPLKEIYGDKYVWYKDIPKDEEELAAAHTKIENALLGLGQVYRDKLQQPDKAISTFESLIRRYPKSEHAPKAYYALYRLYENLDPYRADDCKEYLCKTWPKSKYCSLANNVNIGEEAAEAESACKSAYNALYEVYKSEDYSTVVSFADFSIQKFNSCALLPNMYYLKGMSYGYMKNLDSLKSVFLLIRDNFPSAEITPTVIGTLAKMGISSKVTDKPEDNEESEPVEGELTANDPRFNGFVEKPKANENFYVLYFVDKETISTNELKIKIQDFNSQYFKDKNLTTSIFFYKKVQHIGYISQFKKVQDAISYIELAEEDENLTQVLQKEGERIVFITPTNFKTAYGKRRFDDYFLFYDQFVLPGLKN